MARLGREIERGWYRILFGRCEVMVDCVDYCGMRRVED